MFKITTKEWNKQHDDYKSIIKGQKYIMKNNGLEPVEIDDKVGQECLWYVFEESYIKYSVLAWSEEDALRIIENSGHIMRLVKNLKLKKPL